MHDSFVYEHWSLLIITVLNSFHHDTICNIFIHIIPNEVSNLSGINMIVDLYKSGLQMGFKITWRLFEILYYYMCLPFISSLGKFPLVDRNLDRKNQDQHIHVEELKFFAFREKVTYVNVDNFVLLEWHSFPRHWCCDHCMLDVKYIIRFTNLFPSNTDIMGTQLCYHEIVPTHAALGCAVIPEYHIAIHMTSFLVT